MSLLWTAQDLVAAMHGRPLGELPEGITGVSIDTRTVQPGDAFFAIKGDRFDGHDFASAAMAAGAALLVVAEAKLPALGRLKVPMIVVDDVLAALGHLGVAARKRSTAKILAVTGSVGKTSTKEMLRHALAPSGEVHAATASFNNHWGVPLTLARMPESAAFGVFEIGMNHAGEIRPLAAMVRPHVAIITTIAAAHLGNFKSLAEIAMAKAEIMEGIEPGGYLLLNRDNEKFSWLKKRAVDLKVGHVRSFGESKQANIRLISADLGPEHSDMVVRLGARDLSVRLGAPGRHLVQNALAVLGAVAFAGADLDRAIEALGKISAEKGRGARHRLQAADGAFTLIDESYNANPASMRAALALLHATPPGAGGRRIAVLGDMLEMGRFAEKVHRELSPAAVESGADLVCLSGPEMKHLQSELSGKVETVHRDSAEDLGTWLKDHVRAGDVVMVKSSLGIGFGKIVKLLTETFPAASTGDAA